MPRPCDPTGTPIRNLQDMLRLISRTDSDIPTVASDGLYGAETRASVEAVQRKYGLPVTGETDFATWETVARLHRDIVRSNTPAVGFFPFFSVDLVLTEGDTGDAVYVVQLLLNSLAGDFENFEALEVTGVYDLPTSALVARFQPLAQLPVTGSVDKRTWDALNGLYNTSPSRME